MASLAAPPDRAPPAGAPRVPRSPEVSEPATVRAVPSRPRTGAARVSAEPGARGAEPAATAPAVEPARDRPPKPGSRIDGSYRVLALLGEGGMGAVLLAQDEHLDRLVAIKVVHPALLDSTGIVRRLETEARVMARVHHPNVVQVHAFGTTDGLPYFVMEHVPGVALDRWLAERVRPGAPLPAHVALALLDPLCRGVHAIHRAGTVHRDVKPGNILVGPALRVVLTDFGLAHLLGRVLRPRGVFASGTPAYMAPELSSDPDPDPALASRADVYSLGVIAFELLTGRQPFVASTIEAMVQAHAYADPPVPSEVRPELSDAFDAVILRALAKSPEDRTASAEELRLGLLAARRMQRGPRVHRVVVADDDPGYLGLLTRTLARSFPGCVVESVPNGVLALAAIERDPPDLALVDLDMPGMNGVELAAAIRARDGKRVPVVVVTGVGSGSDWDLLERLGVDGIVVKPFDPEQLLTLARALVEPAPQAI